MSAGAILLTVMAGLLVGVLMAFVIVGPNVVR